MLRGSTHTGETIKFRFREIIVDQSDVHESVLNLRQAHGRLVQEFKYFSTFDLLNLSAGDLDR